MPSRLSKLYIEADLKQPLRFDKLINVTIEDSFDIVNFNIRAMVFDHLIRMEHIGANLVAPFYLSSLEIYRPFSLALRSSSSSL